MEPTGMRRPTVRRKHLLTDQQLAPHAAATATDLAQGHRSGNGVRIHRTYILVVSLMALALLLAASVVLSTRM